MWATVLKYAVKFKGYILAVVLTTVLYLSTGWYLGNVREQSYNKGVSDTNTVWEKRASDYQAEVNSTKSENEKLNSLLEDQIDYSNRLQDSLSLTTNAAVDSYKKSTKGSKVSLDEEFIDVYNTSLGGHHDK